MNSFQFCILIFTLGAGFKQKYWAALWFIFAIIAGLMELGKLPVA